MQDARAFHHRTSRVGTHGITIGIVFVCFVVFVGAVFWFRTSQKESLETKKDSIVDVLTPTPVASSIVEGAIDLESPQATLTNLVSGKVIGTATRGTQDSAYRVAMNASLPEIDREKQFYQAWLVRKIPYDYLSAVEFMTNDLGVFVLEWIGEPQKDYRAYTKVVITLQTKGGDQAPQTHIAEGEFGK
jgi:hypothetical protein